MDRLDAMRTVVEAADAGSLSAAGRRLGVPLATISRKVSELEAHLRTQVFVRTSRRLSLTEAGRAYVDACRRILDDVTETERAASGEYAAPRGHLTVAAPIVFGRLHVLPVIVSFMAAYPDINIQLVQSDRLVDFIEDHIDVAIRIGVLPESSLIASKLGDVRQVVCASRAYLAKCGEPKTPADLAHHDCITFERLNDNKAWTFRRGDAFFSAPVRTRLIVNTAEAAIDAACAGAGVARALSYQADRAMRERSIKRVLCAFEPAPSPVHLVYPAAGRMPIKLRAFLDFAAPRLRDGLARVR